MRDRLIRLILLGGFAALWMNHAFAQESLLEPSTKFLPRENALGFGFQVNNHGLGFFARYFRQLGNPKNELVFNLGVSSVRDGREVRVESAFSDEGGRAFVWDKRNYAYNLSFIGGFQRVLFPLTEFNRLSVRVGFEGGLLLGVLKPYYIEYWVGNELITEQFDYLKHDRRFIIGEADFFNGMTDLNVVPGARMGAFATFNLAGSNFLLRAVHLGLQSDFYARKLNILDSGNDRAVFLTGHIGFFVGNGW